LSKKEKKLVAYTPSPPPFRRLSSASSTSVRLPLPLPLRRELLERLGGESRRTRGGDRGGVGGRGVRRLRGGRRRDDEEAATGAETRRLGRAAFFPGEQGRPSLVAPPSSPSRASALPLPLPLLLAGAARAASRADFAGTRGGSPRRVAP
jgi:hypothetical protein